ncbi:lysophospholipid acyltransferase family protein [Marinicella sp. S1101]|uniref:lysophospholipid acyltransferase family protein n=1 Tax=Marinicella marina TaxID=2996016 RepID=UPI002260882F|nr:lysophospholipid acyltransferase family protein [Marinicella marina]MCX7552728.1 lysophospholipid acyltransferase family protein [Marinicella marina]MDJ1139963.1 lysophospholipid acyltransferase family protein [Marinicella marina]
MKTLIHIVRFTLRITAFILALVFVLPFVIMGILLAKLFRNNPVNEFLLVYWSRLLCFICGLKVYVHGVKPDAPVFLVANHVSWLDIPVIHSLMRAGFVAKNEIKYWPILGLITMVGDTLFLKRGNAQSRKGVITQIKKRLNAGRSVAVFPEGTVTDGSHLRTFHRQLIHAAIETKTPILPVAIKFINSNGTRNDRVGFLNDEFFLSSVWRILTLPNSTVEVHCGGLVTDFDLGARTVTTQARAYIEQELLRNDYMSTTHQA